jgi:hypothetical protein
MGFFLASVSLLRRLGSRLSLCGILAPGGVRLREPIRSRRALPEGSQRSPNYYERWLGAEDRKPYGGNLYLAFGKAHTEEAA